MMLTQSPATETRDSLGHHVAEEKVRGFVLTVDADRREVVVTLSTGPEQLFIPPNCLIFLHGERIKLRLVQAGDEVCVTFVRYRENRSVKVIHVQPNGFLPIDQKSPPQKQA